MAKIIGVSKFERLFREAAGLDVDKNDLARLNDFVRQKVYDLLLAAQATAKDNQRDVIQLHDLPLTLGFKESMRAFDGLDTALELQPILDQLVALPPLDLSFLRALRGAHPQRLPPATGRRGVPSLSGWAGILALPLEQEAFLHA